MQLLSKISFTVFLFAVGIQVVAQQTDTSSADTVKHFETRHTRDDKKLDPKTEKAIKKGNRYFAHGPEKYEDALQEYLKAFNAHPDNSYVNFKIGQCYLLGRKSKNMAVHYLERAYLHSRKVDKLITYYLAKAYQINDNFDGSIEMYQKSIRAFKRAGRKSPTSHGHLLSRQQVEQGIAMCKKGITECETATDIIERPIRVYIENMGDSINSEYPDYDPYISGDESMLFFTSRRQDTRGGKLAEIDAGYYEDIYIAKKVNGHWRKAERMHNRFNKKTNDAIIGLSNDGKKMFVYRDSDNGDIYLSYLEKGEWGAPKYLKGINSAHHESSACFSHDETAIFFTSDRPGGIGYSDIYMSKRKENFKWSEPVNLGPKINSPYDEERVYLHPNGKELYFASQGHNSIGGFDIFKSTLNTEDSTWSEPVNIGYPINTSDDEVSFVIAANGKRGYYASIQPFGLGEKDIYVATFLDYDTMDVAEIKKAFITVANKVDTLGMLAPLLSNAELHDLEQMNDILKEKEQQLNMLKMALEDVYNTVILVPDEDLEEGQTKKDIEQMQENIRQQEEQIISIRATLLEAEDAAQLMELEKVEAQNLQHIKQLKQEVEQQEEQLTNFRLDLKEAEDVAMAYPNKKNRKAAEGLKAQIQEAKEEINYMKLDLKDAQEHAAMLTDKTYERLSEDASPEERMAKEEEELELLNLELMDAVDVAIMQMDEATALALREKRAEVSEKEEELIQLQMKLMETKDPEIEVDEQTMAALAALENQVKEKETELTVLRLELKKAVDDAVIQVDEELRAEILDLEQKVTEKEQRVIGMKLKLFARDDVEMVLPETELAEKDEALDIETLQMQIEAKQYELENLRETLKEVEKTEFPTEEEKQQAITVMQQQIANKEQELTQLQLTLNNALALVQQEKEVIVLKNNEIPEKAVKWQVRYTEKEEELPSGLVVYYMDENDNIIHKEPIDKKGFFTYHELPPNQEYIFKVMFDGEELCDKMLISLLGIQDVDYQLMHDENCVFRFMERMSPDIASVTKEEQPGTFNADVLAEILETRYNLLEKDELQNAIALKKDEVLKLQQTLKEVKNTEFDSEEEKQQAIITLITQLKAKEKALEKLDTEYTEYHKTQFWEVEELSQNQRTDYVGFLESKVAKNSEELSLLKTALGYATDAGQSQNLQSEEDKQQYVASLQQQVERKETELSTLNLMLRNAQDTIETMEQKAVPDKDMQALLDASEHSLSLLNMALKQAYDMSVDVFDIEKFNYEYTEEISKLEAEFKKKEIELQELKKAFDDALDISTLILDYESSDLEKLGRIDKLEEAIRKKENDLNIIKRGLNLLEQNVDSIEFHLKSPDTGNPQVDSLITSHNKLRQQNLVVIKKAIVKIKDDVYKVENAIAIADKVVKKEYANLLKSEVKRKQQELAALRLAKKDAESAGGDEEAREQYMKNLDKAIQKKEDELMLLNIALEETGGKGAVSGTAKRDYLGKLERKIEQKEQEARLFEQAFREASNTETKLTENERKAYVNSLNSEISDKQNKAGLYSNALSDAENVVKQAATVSQIKEDTTADEQKEESQAQIDTQQAEKETQLAQQTVSEKELIVDAASKEEIIDSATEIGSETKSEVATSAESEAAKENDQGLKAKIESKENELYNLRYALKETQNTQFDSEKEKQEAVQMLTAQIEKKEKELAQLTAYLEEASTAAIERDAGVDVPKGDAEELKTKIESKENELYNLRYALKETQNTQFDSEKEKQEAVQMLTAQIEKKEKELEQLTAYLKATSNIVIEIATEIDAPKGDAEGLKAKIESKENELYNLRYALKETQNTQFDSEKEKQEAVQMLIAQIEKKEKELGKFITFLKEVEIFATASKLDVSSETGVITTLNNVLFGFDRYDISAAFKKELDRIYGILNKNPELKLEITGHTDSKGRDAYNQVLSERRANIVYNYLTSKGIAKNRFIVQGYGESRPIAPNAYPDGTDYPDGRRQNRRTEFRIAK